MSSEISIGYITDPLIGSEKKLVLKENQHGTCILVNNGQPPIIYIDHKNQFTPITNEDLSSDEYRKKIEDGSFKNATNYLNKSMGRS